MFRKRLAGSVPVLLLVAVVSMTLAGPALAAEPPTVTKVEPTNGPAGGGTPVTITGTGFNGATAVKFGSTAATSFTVNSGASITAVSPPGVPGYPTGKVNVTVTTPAGTSENKIAGVGEFAYDPIITGIEPNTGPTAGGTLVTIHGEGFAEPPQPPPPFAPHAPDCVSFSGSTFPCTEPREVSNTLIRVVAPAGTGVVDVRVTNLEGGVSATSPADLFGYGAPPPPPPPTVAKVEPNHGPAAGGTTVTITGTDLAETSIVEFGGLPALSFTVNSATSITAVSPGGISGETVDVTVNTPAGISATGPADRFTFESQPQPSVTNVEPNHGPNAGGTSVTITGTNFTGVSAVKFGSVNATSFKVESEGRITAVAPAGTGTVDVTVSTAGGTSSSGAADHFSYEPAADPSPRWFINGKPAVSKHEPAFALGKIELKGPDIKQIVCKGFTSMNIWNETKEGTERGFDETTGQYYGECKDAVPCVVTNENGVEKEGTFVTVEGPPTFQETEKKARRTGNTSVPWTGELIETEKAVFDVTHHLKLWLVTPLGEEVGGPGKGAGCKLTGGIEILFEDQEGTTEKAAGDEIKPRLVNGVKSGMSPSHSIFNGEKTEKSGAPETGRLNSPIFGPVYLTGELKGPSGETDYELVTAK